MIVGLFKQSMCLFPGISSVNTTTNPKVNKDTLYIIINVVLEFMNLDVIKMSFGRKTCKFIPTKKDSTFFATYTI